MNKKLTIPVSWAVGLATGIIGVLAYQNTEQLQLPLLVIIALIVLLGSAVMGAFIGMRFLQLGADISLQLLVSDNEQDAKKIDAMARLMGNAVKSVARGSSLTLKDGAPQQWLPETILEFEKEN